MRSIARGLFALPILLAACVPPPTLRLTSRAELDPTVAVRAEPGYEGVPPEIRQSAVDALRDVGYVVLTSEARRPAEYLLVLRAKCTRDLLLRWRCSEFVMRLVDRQSTEIRAAASIVPLTPSSPRMAAIRDALADSLRANLRRQGGPR